MSGIDRVHYVPGLSPQSTHKVQPADRERSKGHEGKQRKKDSHDLVGLQLNEEAMISFEHMQKLDEIPHLLDINV